jgi:outer membrane lipoprotein-sorting protein
MPFRLITRLKHTHRSVVGRLVFIVVLCAMLCGFANAQTSEQADHSSAEARAGQLNANQVVSHLTQMNTARAQALHSYESTRVYRLEYKGFPGGRSAEMVVKVKYRAPGTKEFEVVSATGSKVVIDRVFKKLLEGEQEASEEDGQKRIAINPENYGFTLEGYERGPQGGRYVLMLSPKTKNKYLFRGRIWVDEAQFAIVRMEGEPAKNPSFWIKDTKVETVYVNVEDFWLPSLNRSMTAVRLGGHADLRIEYKDYRVTGISPASKVTSAAQQGR